MKQSSRRYTGLLTIALGIVMVPVVDLSVYLVTPIGLVIFGGIQLLSSQVSCLQIGPVRVGLREFLAAESLVGAVCSGVWHSRGPGRQ